MAVVMPVLNEEQHLEEAVRAVLEQRYPGPVRVALALGPSTDGTDEVARRLADADSRVLLVANPSGRTPRR
nr:glycosyltransferase [Angustibacter aerolatus]